MVDRNAGIRNTITVVINNRMKCMMHILIISNIIMCIIKLYINTKPITNALAASDGRTCGPRWVGPMTHDRPLPTPAARVVAIHEDNTAARPSQSM